MLKFLKNIWSITRDNSLHSVTIIKMHGFLLLAHGVGCIAFYFNAKWKGNREIPIQTIYDLIPTDYAKKYLDEKIEYLLSWNKKYPEFFKFKDVRPELEEIECKVSEVVNFCKDKTYFKFCHVVINSKFPFPDRFIEAERSRLCWEIDRILTGLIPMVDVLWVAAAILILLFSIPDLVQRLKQKMNKGVTIPSSYSDLGWKFTVFSIIFYMVVYNLIALRLLTHFETLINIPWFELQFYPSFALVGLTPMKYLIVYIVTLIYPMVTLVGFRNDKFIVSLGTRSKFFIFYLLTFTLYLFFLYAINSKNFLDFFIAIEGQSFTFIVIIAIMRSRVNYSLLISYILQIIWCSGFILLGIAIFYYNFDSFWFLKIHTVDVSASSDKQLWLCIGLFTFLFGVAGKSGAFPFFKWPFDLYTSIPIPLVFISAVINKVGILIPTFFMLKCCFATTLSQLSPTVIVVLTFSISGLIFACCYGLSIKTTRELIAASSISQTSYIFILILNPVVFGEIIIALYLIGYTFALITLCLFLISQEAFRFGETETKPKFGKPEIDPALTKRIRSEFNQGSIIWVTIGNIGGLPPSTFFSSKFAFLSNIYINMLELGGIIGIVLLVVFFLANFLNIIIYVKLVFNNLNSTDENSKMIFKYKDKYSKIYWRSLALVTLLVFIVIFKDNV